MVILNIKAIQEGLPWIHELSKKEKHCQILYAPLTTDNKKASQADVKNICNLLPAIYKFSNLLSAIYSMRLGFSHKKGSKREISTRNKINAIMENLKFSLLTWSNRERSLRCFSYYSVELIWNIQSTKVLTGEETQWHSESS